MNIAVRFYTRSGNTEKLANAIAEVIGEKAESDRCTKDAPMQMN